MAIFKSERPQNSLLNNGEEYDYIDSFSGDIDNAGQPITSTELGKVFFSSAPKWVGKLMSVRDAVVTLAGLKTSGDKDKSKSQLQDFRCEPGERIGLFKVFSKTDNEVILGQDDKHLNFRISLYLGQAATGLQKRFTVSTAVKFNNSFGRFYFSAVKPFHRLIVPQMLKAMLKALEATAENRVQGFAD